MKKLIALTATGIVSLLVYLMLHSILFSIMTFFSLLLVIFFAELIIRHPKIIFIVSAVIIMFLVVTASIGVAYWNYKTQEWSKFPTEVDPSNMEDQVHVAYYSSQYVSGLAVLSLLSKQFQVHSDNSKWTCTWQHSSGWSYGIEGLNLSHISSIDQTGLEMIHAYVTLGGNPFGDGAKRTVAPTLEEAKELIQEHIEKEIPCYNLLEFVYNNFPVLAIPFQDVDRWYILVFYKEEAKLELLSAKGTLLPLTSQEDFDEACADFNKFQPTYLGTNRIVSFAGTSFQGYSTMFFIMFLVVACATLIVLFFWKFFRMRRGGIVRFIATATMFSVSAFFFFKIFEIFLGSATYRATGVLETALAIVQLFVWLYLTVLPMIYVGRYVYIIYVKRKDAPWYITYFVVGSIMIVIGVIWGFVLLLAFSYLLGGII